MLGTDVLSARVPRRPTLDYSVVQVRSLPANVCGLCYWNICMAAAPYSIPLTVPGHGSRPHRPLHFLHWLLWSITCWRLYHLSTTDSIDWLQEVSVSFQLPARKASRLFCTETRMYNMTLMSSCTKYQWVINKVRGNECITLELALTFC